MKDELKDMTADQLEQLLEQKRAEERQAADKRRRDYEETRADFVKRMAAETRNITGRVREFYDLVVAETDAFRKIMQEYGATRRDDPARLLGAGGRLPPRGEMQSGKML